jgi:hypothetical protein
MSGGLKRLGSDLGSLVAQLEQRADTALDLLRQVHDALPEAEKIHVLSANYRQDTLVLVVDSAVWASRIRYCEAALRAALPPQDEKPFTKLKVRVGRP